MHAPYAPKIENTEGPKGLRPLGARYLASCSQQLWSSRNAFYAVSASSHICLLGSHMFENYEVTGGHAGEYLPKSGIETFRFTREALQ